MEIFDPRHVRNELASYDFRTLVLPLWIPNILHHNHCILSPKDPRVNIWVSRGFNTTEENDKAA